MNTATPNSRTSDLYRNARRCLCLGVLPALVWCLSIQPAEPVFDGDSNRHVMTSVFFRDFLADGQYTAPKAYAEAYYEQYPALGLLVWPPLFHGVCGAVMLIFGTSVVVPRILIVGFLIVSARSVYRIARRVIDPELAMLTTIVYALLPFVFRYSHDVMLEMPTLMLCLLSAEHFDQWTANERRRSLYIAAVTAALAALTRFDAVMLLPFYFFTLLLRGRWKRLWTWHVAAAAGLAICLIAPVYLLIAKEMGSLHIRQAAESVGGSVDGSAGGFLSLNNLLFYPSALPEQCGWPVAILATGGLLAAVGLRKSRRFVIFLALVLATYVTFTPLAELRARHSLYWLPSAAFFAVFAADAAAKLLAEGFGKALRFSTTVVVYALLLSSTAWSTLQEPSYRVEGYRQAAAFVLKQTSPGDRVFFDGWWDGNFTYYMRHLDPDRSRHIIRGDRLLYDFVCVPATDFQQHVETDADILAALTRSDPEYVVIENPQFFETIEIAQRLRDLIHARPEIFVPVEVIPVQSSLTHKTKFRLEIYEYRPVAPSP